MFLLLIDPISAQADCPNGEDYSPCTCKIVAPDRPSLVVCNKTSLAEVSRVFQRTTSAELEKFTLELPSTSDPTEIIPMDLLNNHRAISIGITCPSPGYSLKIDPQAFRSSKPVTRAIYINDFCDMNQLNFQFLSGFDQIHTAGFSSVSNFDRADWASFPTLPALKEIVIRQSTGLNEWTAFPKLSSGLLTDLTLVSCDIQDEAMDRILNWTVQHAADSLEFLWIAGNKLTKIPAQIKAPSLLPKLKYLIMPDQKKRILSIPSGSFHGISPNSVFDLQNNSIASIQDRAFQGIISYIIKQTAVKRIICSLLIF